MEIKRFSEKSRNHLKSFNTEQLPFRREIPLFYEKCRLQKIINQQKFDHETHAQKLLFKTSLPPI
jgi:hypothetical protein